MAKIFSESLSFMYIFTGYYRMSQSTKTMVAHKWRQMKAKMETIGYENSTSCFIALELKRLPRP